MEKDKTLAGILSFIMPGLGQIYVGSTIRGIVWFIIYFGILVATVMDGIFFFVLLTAMFLSIWDAVNEAEICNGRKIRKG